MKIINLFEAPLYLDDIDKLVPYSKDNKAFEIDDFIASKSMTLKFAFKNKMLIEESLYIKNNAKKEESIKIKEDIKPVVKKDSFLVNNLAPNVKPAEFNQAAEMLTLSNTDESKKTYPEGILKPAKEIFKETGEMNFIYSGTAYDGGGYSRMNREFMLGLTKLGAKVKWESMNSKNDMDSETSAKLGKLCGTKVPLDTPKIYGTTAPKHYTWERYKILITMMETKTLHPDYVYNCNCADDIIVPSHWCKKVFEESGVKKPLTVVPLGVNTKLYTPDAPARSFNGKLKNYVFLSIFGWSLRKGYDVLLKAYLEEFTSDDDVSLLISSRYFGSTDKSKKDIIKNDIKGVVSTVRNKNLPHLSFFGDSLSDAAMPSLFTACNCSVLPSRGEGFSLFPLESGACGLPVITTRYSGQTDFLDDDNSYLIDVDGFGPCPRSLEGISQYYENAEFPLLGKAAVEQTRYLMRHVYENQDEANAKAKVLRDKILLNYDWENSSNQLYNALKGIYNKF